MRLAEKHVVSSGQPRVCVADGAGWPCDTRLALDVVDALLSERSVPPPAAPGLREAAQRLVDVIFAEAQAEPFVLPLRGMRAANDLRAALAETPGEPREGTT